MSDHNDSSSDDEDYVPIAEGSESESDDEGSLSGHQKDQSMPSKSKKRKKKGEIFSSRKRKGGIKLDEDGSENSLGSEDVGIVEGTEEKSSAEVALEELSEDLKKKKADDLWSSFLKDVNVPSKPKQPMSSSTLIHKPHTSLNTPHSQSEKVTVTKIFHFAGEEVKVTEVKSDSNKHLLDKPKELSSSARLISSPEETDALSSNSAKLIDSTPELVKPIKGLTSVLNKINNKKNNINTLMKSKLDWDSYKMKEGIKDDLQIHNKGKDGYLEKMAFLERTDLRQFEIEKSLRATSRNKK